MKKRAAVILAFVLGISTLTACGSKNDTPVPTSGEGTGDLMVAAIFGGAINDGNWNETQYNGLKDIEGLGAGINYLENIGDTEAAEAARTYATEGYQLVYLTTNSYQDYCTSVAAEFPDVMFVQINGTEITDNFKSVRIADEEQGFMQGVIAALLTETGHVGFVGGLEINPIILGTTGFKQGVDYANETYGLNVTAHTINTGSFTDVNKAKETAIAMIEGNNVDVITPMANDASIGVMEAAEEKGVMAIACGLGQEDSAPTATQITVVKDVAVAYQVTYDAYTKGELAGVSEVETYGANKGVVYVTDWFVEADADVRDKVADVMDKLGKSEILISTETN